VHRGDIERRGGRGLFQGRSTLAEVLREVYPSEDWQEDKFVRYKSFFPGYWKSLDSQRAFLEELRDKLDIKEVCCIPLPFPFDTCGLFSCQAV